MSFLCARSSSFWISKRSKVEKIPSAVFVPMPLILVIALADEPRIRSMEPK